MIKYQDIFRCSAWMRDVLKVSCYTLHCISIRRSREDTRLKSNIMSKILCMGVKSKPTAPHITTGLIICHRKLDCHFD